MTLLHFLAYIGTIAFAVSGALLGIQKKLDLFGVLFLSAVTALGGGLIRDVFIGSIPPVAFREPVYFSLSVLAALLTWFFYGKMPKFKNIIQTFDAVGLGVFTAVGAHAAFLRFSDQPFLVVAMGLMTGIGGGILRDVFVKDIPLVFRKEIYAVASILGAMAFYYSCRIFPVLVSQYVAFALILAVRLLAIRYAVNLPVFKSHDARPGMDL